MRNMRIEKLYPETYCIANTTYSKDMLDTMMHRANWVRKTFILKREQLYFSRIEITGDEEKYVLILSMTNFDHYLIVRLDTDGNTDDDIFYNHGCPEYMVRVARFHLRGDTTLQEALK